jgi:spore coat protein A, manganese oxidase
VPADSDGYPEDHFAPGEQSKLYTYPNGQQAATLWYHDHALGITRLNVYMGLAGFYLVRDDAEDALDLPRGEFEVPLAIQDRTFWPDGQLYYPDMWHEHFYGDKILVNGKVWPYLEVKQGKYRFRLLNGSNSRTYKLALSNRASFWQIASDNGLLSVPLPISELVLTPGERADVVIDFQGYAAGTEIVLSNSAPTHYPGTPGVGVVPNVMQFRVVGQTGHTSALPASLVPVVPTDPSSALLQRTLELRQVASACPGHTEGMWTIDGEEWHAITEEPRLGTTEIWAWKNPSSITHPMHMHLVSVQVLDRQEFDSVTGVPFGPLIPPAANELGWKDTVQAPPGHITRVIARFEDFAGLFAYHCHILEHEDHEMMRQMRVLDDMIPFCFGDGTQTTPCPCANVGEAGHGCGNSIQPSGALLSASGTVVPDALTLSSSFEPPVAFSILLQGTLEFANGVNFGDGLRCVGGNLKRLYVRAASNGTVAFPAPGDIPIATKSALLGDPIAPGSTRSYQVYYRDSILSFCPLPPGNSWNVSNGMRITW